MREDYPLASISTIRDAFIVAYRHCDNGNGEHVEMLAKSLSEKLSEGGRGNISLWQLRWFLSQHTDNPESAVRDADILIQSDAVSTHSPRHMTCFEFLTRAGCEDQWFKFEDAGYRLASELKAGLKDKKAIQELKVSARQAKFLNVMIRNESKNNVEKVR